MVGSSRDQLVPREGAGGRGAQLGRHNYGSGTVLPAEFIANPELHTPEMLPAGALDSRGGKHDWVSHNLYRGL